MIYEFYTAGMPEMCFKNTSCFAFNKSFSLPSVYIDDKHKHMSNLFVSKKPNVNKRLHFVDSV